MHVMTLTVYSLLQHLSNQTMLCTSKWGSSVAVNFILEAWRLDALCNRKCPRSYFSSFSQLHLSSIRNEGHVRDDWFSCKNSEETTRSVFSRRANVGMGCSTTKRFQCPFPLVDPAWISRFSSTWPCTRELMTPNSLQKGQIISSGI
jgi:hypothetical protein